MKFLFNNLDYPLKKYVFQEKKLQLLKCVVWYQEYMKQKHWWNIFRANVNVNLMVKNEHQTKNGMVIIINVSIKNKVLCMQRRANAWNPSICVSA